MWRRQLLYQTLGTISYRRLLHSHFPPVVCMQSLTWLPALPSWSTQYKSTPYLCKDSDRTLTQRNQLKASTPTISTGERFVRYNQSRGSCKTCFQCKTFTRVVFQSCSPLQSALQKSVCVCVREQRGLRSKKIIICSDPTSMRKYLHTSHIDTQIKNDICEK